MVDGEIKSLYVRVMAYDNDKPDDASPEQEYVWDYYNLDHKKKFNGLLKWAVQNNHDIQISSATEAEFQAHARKVS